ncbi:MAG: hypothetical protein EXS38_09685 [Opitutus sp.]|nr:hypothetical protein [Opitutus sp.]
MVRQRNAESDCSYLTGALVVVLLLAGPLAAEWIQTQRRETLAASLSVLGPTLAHEIEKMGHADVTAAAALASPASQAMAAAEGDWLRSIVRSLASSRTARHRTALSMS